MTKPSYEELVKANRDLHSYLKLYERTDELVATDHVSLAALRSDMIAAVERAEKSEAELARVRGLLQRVDDQLMRVNDSPDAILNDIADILREGAESADIGKLDTADKVTIEERHYDDGTIERKIGDGKWEEVPNPSGKPLFAKVEMGKVNRVEEGEK